MSYCKTFNVRLQSSGIKIQGKSYKGGFNTAEELNSIFAVEGDYADVYETNTRWVYTSGAWTDTGEAIAISPKIVTTEKLSTSATPDTIPLRDNNGHIYIREPTEDDHPVTKKYLDEKIKEIKNVLENPTLTIPTI